MKNDKKSAKKDKKQTLNNFEHITYYLKTYYKNFVKILKEGGIYQEAFIKKWLAESGVYQRVAFTRGRRPLEEIR